MDVSRPKRCQLIKRIKKENDSFSSSNLLDPSAFPGCPVSSGILFTLRRPMGTERADAARRFETKHASEKEKERGLRKIIL